MATLSPNGKLLGRPVTKPNGFTPEQAERICELIRSGMTLKQVEQSEGFSDSLIIWNARKCPIFAKQYTEAMAARTDIDFERLQDLAFKDPERTERGIDMAWVQLQRLRVDTVKWALSKRNPKKYGDRMQVDGEVTFSLADSILEARQRALADDETLQLGSGDPQPE